jgi:UDPglucose 6-dehydrogenase
MKPDRIIVGTDNPRTTELLRALYEPFNRNRDRMMIMDVRSAELTKYAANAMLATKMSFMNELANIAERVGADIEQVRVGIGSDPRIGYQFIYPGAGYGGSCFPKDVRALAKSAAGAGYDAALMQAVETINNRQKRVLFDKVSARFDDDLQGRTIALWGLSFKPRTDDMREASSRVLMEALWDAGAHVRAYDPEAMEEARRLYPDQPGLTLCDSSNDALQGADALAIVTEWQEFRSPDFESIKSALRQPVIFDGRNLYDPSLLQRLGIEYFAIGRGRSLATFDYQGPERRTISRK